jgi:hypothetical protein
MLSQTLSGPHLLLRQSIDRHSHCLDWMRGDKTEKSGGDTIHLSVAEPNQAF